MYYTDTAFDGMLEPYFRRMEEELLPRFQARIGDRSPLTAERYGAYLRRHYRASMFRDMITIHDEVAPPAEGDWEGQLEANLTFCANWEASSLEKGSTKWLVSRLEAPTWTDEDNRKVANLIGFTYDARHLVLATVLGKVSPNPDDYESQFRRFAELSATVPDGLWKGHPMVPKSPFTVSDTIDNLRCAYGRETLWKAPIFRSRESLLQAGPLDETTYEGNLNMRYVRQMVGEEPVPLPVGVDWEKAVREQDETLLYGDWKTEMPADMAKALEWYKKARQEGEPLPMTAE